MPMALQRDFDHSRLPHAARPDIPDDLGRRHHDAFGTGIPIVFGGVLRDHRPPPEIPAARSG
jgi:hypothetical protein